MTCVVLLGSIYPGTSFLCGYVRMDEYLGGRVNKQAFNLGQACCLERDCSADVFQCVFVLACPAHPTPTAMLTTSIPKSIPRCVVAEFREEVATKSREPAPFHRLLHQPLSCCYSTS